MEIFEVQHHPADMGPGAALGKRVSTDGTDIGYDITDVFIFSHNFLDLGHQPIGGVQIGAFRHFDINIRPARLGFGKKFRALSEKEKSQGSANQQDNRHRDDHPAMLQRPFEQKQINLFNTWLADLRVFGGRAGFNFLITGGQHRIDHQRHKQRSTQGHNQGHGQVPHELAHNTRPEQHGRKSRQGGQGGRNHRPGHLVGCRSGCLCAVFALLHMAVNIFDNDNAVVHQHPQRQNQ